MGSFRETLFSKNFFTIWFSQIVSEFGDKLNQMALVALVYSRAPGSVAAMAKLVFFIVIPVFLIGPLAGACVDRWSRKKVMIVSDVARGFMVIAIPFLVVTGMMVPVYVLIFLSFSATRFFLPSKMAIIPSVVSEDKLLAANTLVSTTRVIASALGFVIAGFLVKWMGYVWGFYIDGATYFISAVLIFTVTVKERSKGISPREDIRDAKEMIETAARKNIWKEIVRGISYMTRPGKMREVALALFVIMSGAGFVFCALIVFVQDVMEGSTGELGVLGACVGAGLFVGTILYGKFCQHFSKVKSMLVSFAFVGIFLSLFVFNEKLVGYLTVRWVSLFLMGFSAGPVVTCANYLVHVSVPDEVRGRVFSGIESVIHLGFIIFMIVSAAVSEFLSTFTILFYSGIVFAVTGTIGAGLAPREKRRT